MLLTAAILAVLAGVAFPALSVIQRNLRQLELDSKARIIYIAAQNQLVKLRGSGNMDLYTPEKAFWPGSDYKEAVRKNGDSRKIYGHDPVLWPADSDPEEFDTEYCPLAYIRGSDINATGSAASYILGAGGEGQKENTTINGELLDAHWIIEYFPGKTGDKAAVYAVYYSESVDLDGLLHGGGDYAFHFSDHYRVDLRQKRGRLADGARVGYYGGANPGSAFASYDVSPSITIDNGEKLVASIECAGPSDGTEIYFEITLSDGTNSFKFDCANSGNPSIYGRERLGYLNRTGIRYNKTIVLDDLSREDWRFHQFWRFTNLASVCPEGTAAGSGGLEPGRDITITVKTKGRKSSGSITQRVTEHKASATANSLFGEGTAADTAVIAAGRHLQNLELLHILKDSMTTRMTKAEQRADIDFRKPDSGGGEGARSWYANYCAPGVNANGTYPRTEPLNIPRDYFNGQAANKANFRPVVLNPGFTYDGAGHTIAGLNVNVSTGGAGGAASGDDADGAGLFAALPGADDSAPGLFPTAAAPTTLKNISLIVDRVTGSGSAGSLAGYASGNYARSESEPKAGNVIENCCVYLDTTARSGAPYGDFSQVEKHVFVSGRNAGGLVGQLRDGASLDISGSFASTVLKAEGGAEGGAAGGLVGLCDEGTADSRTRLNLSESYADSYIYGFNAGGLAGFSGTDTGKTEIVMKDCYAAGFLFPEDRGSAAGLVNGAVSDGQRSYTVCELGKGTALGQTFYTTARSIGGGSASTVCYNMKSGIGGYEYLPGTAAFDDLASDDTARQMAELLTRLGGQFTLSDRSAQPYKLAKELDSLTASYPYPYLRRFTGTAHYGDWGAVFQPGGLFYYEKYQIAGNTEYSIYGTGEMELKTDGEILGDGYGIVYRSDDPLPSQLELYINDYDGTKPAARRTVIPLEEANRYAVRDSASGHTFYIYPLPTELCNPALAGKKEADYYYLATITATGSTSALPRYYYFNPHLAKTVEGPLPVLPSREDLASRNPSDAYVRSPRHLYNMSLYYNYFADRAASCTFWQERDISYSSYQWDQFFKAGSGIIEVQEPIGQGDGKGANPKPFQSVYDGQCYSIKDLSVASQSGDYVGLFGMNAGELKNIVLATPYKEGDPHNHTIRRRDSIKQQGLQGNDWVYLGALAGYNAEGASITNCAVAGYYASGAEGTIVSDQGGYPYVGGFVGWNAGTITACSASSPEISLSAKDSDAYMGGFTGGNSDTGVIRNCYALGHLRAFRYGRGHVVSLAGFAGRNEGQIENSYCGVSLVQTGEADRCAFAPGGGNVRGSYYLDKGTYRYIQEHLRPYENENSAGVAEGRTYQELADMAAASGQNVDEKRSLCHESTETSRAYPFPAVVRDGAGKLVHYGDWQLEAILGTVGMFYWEHETGGNEGYHLTYVGYNVDSGGGPVLGTSLCVQHDDGGVIDQYGYGIYVSRGKSDRVAVAETACLDWSVGGSLAASATTINEAAKAGLEKQMTAFEFFPVTTKADPSGDYIRLKSEKDEAIGYKDREAAITIRYGEADAEDDKVPFLTYHVSPFFANAMRLKECRIGEQAAQFRDEDLKQSEVSKSSQHDYKLETGGAGNPYEIRSIQQLQYINWNADASVMNTNQVVNEGNRKNFPYLQYYPNDGTWNKDNNFEDFSKRKTAAETLRPRQYWAQSHDLNGQTYHVPFTPIAGAGTSSMEGNSGYAYLWAWFGGNYDGQSYKVQNFDIHSGCFTVGLFGVTVGASLKNVILYSDRNSVIERVTPGASKKNTMPGAYTMGGLVGTAYDYNPAVADNESAIENCAIAGYVIEDNSTNKQTRGGAIIGGLTGVADVVMRRCTSVVDIHINCTHDNGCSGYGSYIRVGGLTGTAQYTVTDCYSGGEVTVSEETIRERYTNQSGGKPSQGYDEDVELTRNNNTFVYIGGIAGSSYTCAYYGFFPYANFESKKESVIDASPTFENCYSYLKMPNLEGTIKGVSHIAGPADRYSHTLTITFRNCWYLDSINRNITYQNPAYHFKEGATTNGNTPVKLSDSDFQDILRGDLKINKRIIQNDSGSAAVVGSPEPVSYDELSDLKDTLGANWNYVTTVERNSTVNGKYSFPGNDISLLGRNYPFPTVIKQPELVFGGADVNVHYGRWPIDGPYWNLGQPAMDIFGSMGTGDDPWAEIVLKLNDDTSFLRTEGLEPAFTVSPENVARVTGWTFDEESRQYAVTVRALRDGSAVITETHSGSSCVLSITATLEISANPSRAFHYSKGLDPGGGRNRTELVLTAVHSGGTKETPIRKAFQGRAQGTWTFTPSDYYSAALAKDSDANRAVASITHYDPNNLVMEAVFTYNYHAGTDESSPDGGGKAFSFTGFIPVKNYGVIGLSADPDLTPGEDGAERRLYSQADRCPPKLSGGKAETVRGTDREADSFGSYPPQLPSGTEGEFFLYESMTDEALDKVTVTDVTLSYENAGTDGGAAVKYVEYYSVDGGGRTEHTHTEAYDASTDQLLSDSEARQDFTVSVGRTGGADSDLVSDPRGEQDGADRSVLYDYLPCHIQFTGGGTIPSKVELTVTLTHSEDREPSGGGDGGTSDGGDGGTSGSGNGGTAGGVDSGTAGGDEITTPYSLSLPLTFLPRFVVSFSPGGGAGTMAPLRVSGDRLTIPACTFTRPGYAFDCWTLRIDGNTQTDENGEAVQYKPGGTLELTGNAVLEARWTPNRYTVYFHPNYETSAEETDNLPRQAFTYDAGQALVGTAVGEEEKRAAYPDGTPFSGYTRENYQFIGWRTADADTIYHTDDTVRNLTTENSVILYAQWSRECVLRLDLNLDSADGTGWDSPSQDFTVYSGLTSSLSSLDSGTDSYIQPVREGYVLLGWYTAKTDGLRALDAEGNRAARVPGYTSYTAFQFPDAPAEAGQPDAVLYAHWAPIRLLTLNLGMDLGDAPVPEGWSVPDGGTEAVRAFQVTNGIHRSLADAGYARPALEGYSLRGWYTEPQGAADTIFSETGSLVLTADGQIAGACPGYTTSLVFDLGEGGRTLYAHWYPERTLTLDLGLESGENAPPLWGAGQASVKIISGAAVGLDGYEAPERTGYALDGWYADAAEGGEGGEIRVLNADGSIAGAVPGWTAAAAPEGGGSEPDGEQDGGYVLKPDADGTLTARWARNPDEIVLFLDGAVSLYDEETYQKPERASFQFMGWYTRKSGGVKVLDADGNLADSETLITDTETDTAYVRDGELLRGFTLYGVWQRNPVLLHAKDGWPEGGTMQYEAVYLADGSANLPAKASPDQENNLRYKLTGWYARLPDQWIPVLDQDGTPVGKNITARASDGGTEAYVLNGELQGGLDLYAGWLLDVWLPVDKLEGGAADNGQYVIVGNGGIGQAGQPFTAGEQIALSAVPSNSVGGLGITVSSGSLPENVYANGRIPNTYILEKNADGSININDASIWTVEYLEEAGGQKIYSFYHNSDAGEGYLNRVVSNTFNGNDTYINLTPEPTDYIPGTNENCGKWAYGRFFDTSSFTGTRTLECKLRATERNNTGDCIYWDGSIFIRESNSHNKQIFLYRMNTTVFHETVEDAAGT